MMIQARCKKTLMPCTYGPTKWQLPVNDSKCKAIHNGCTNLQTKYKIGDTIIVGDKKE